MPEQSDSATRVVTETVLTTLVGLFLSVVLILTFAMSVSPKFGYDFYVGIGSERGAYLYAKKLVEASDRALERQKDPKSYNRQVRLPAYDRAIRHGLKLFSERGQASGLTGLSERMFADEDFGAFCAAVDVAAKNKTARDRHVYVVGYDAYLTGKYTEALYAESAERAKTFATDRYEAWLDKVRIPDFGNSYAEGSFVTYLTLVVSSADETETQGYYLSLTDAIATGALDAVRAASEEAWLNALTLCKTVRQLLDLFALRLGETYDVAELSVQWRSEFNRLQRVYAAAGSQEQN